MGTILPAAKPNSTPSQFHIKMSAKGKSSKVESVTYLDMAIKAIQSLKDRKGASRSAIARWIQINYNKEGGPSFNAYLRAAIKKGMESGVLKEGQSAQRFKIGVLPKVEKPKKRVVSKKKNSSKKKTTSKKKTVSKKKSSSKKVGSKKKVVTKRKTPTKKKTASKKKTSSKKKTASKKKVG